MEHTPGPWIIEKGKKRINTEAIIISAKDGLGPVAFSTEPNACLIAAAPELLAALKSWITFQKFYEANTHGDKFPGNVFYQEKAMQIIEKTQAAIAKAEG